MTKYIIIAILLGITLTYTARANDELVAAVICMEAGGEGRLGMQAVMSVIANRSNLHQRSYAAIVRQPKQFSCMNGITNESKAIESAKKKWPNQFPVALNMVKLARQGRLADVTNGAYFYQTIECKVMSWHGERTVTIGRHTFFKRKN